MISFSTFSISSISKKEVLAVYIQRKPPVKDSSRLQTLKIYSIIISNTGIFRNPIPGRKHKDPVHWEH